MGSEGQASGVASLRLEDKRDVKDLINRESSIGMANLYGVRNDSIGSVHLVSRI